MKKRIIGAILASMILAFSFTACKSDNGEIPTDSNSVSDVEVSAESSDEHEEEENPVPESEVARFDGLIEEEYAEELTKVETNKEYTYTSTRQANALLRAEDRYYIIIDEYDGENSLFAATIYCYSSSDDSLLWEKAYGSNNITSLPAAKLLSDGSLVVAGATSSTKGRFEGIKDDRDNTAFIARLDKDGNEMWLKTWDDLDHESFTRIEVTSNDDIIVSAGSTSDKGQSAYVKCYDKDGNVKWDNKLGDGITSAPGLIVVNEDKGEISVVGIYSASSFETNNYIMRFDMDGNIIGDKLDIGNYTKLAIAHMCYISDNEVAISGRYYDDNYALAQSVVSHEEEHAGTADPSYNRYAPGYLFTYNLDTQEIGWEYKSHGYLGGNISSVWIDGDNINAIGTRFATQVETPSGNSISGDSLLLKFSKDGTLLSREAIKDSSVEENEDCFMSIYRPDGDGFITVTEVWPEQ